MCKLIKCEFLRIIKNKNIMIIFLLINIVISGYGFYYMNMKHHFVNEQYEEAQIMIDSIRMSNNENQYEYQQLSQIYSQLLYAQTWQECYHMLNQIDELYIQYPQLIEKNKSDLAFDYKTNIEYRNYCLKYQINPDEQSAYCYIDFTMSKGSDIFLLIGLAFIIFVCLYEDKENEYYYYIYGLGYTYKYIVLSQVIVRIIASVFLVVIPFLYMFLIMGLIYGWGNENILVLSSMQYKNILINDLCFIPITTYILEIIKSLILEIICVNVYIECLDKIKYENLLSFIIPSCLFAGIYILDFPNLVGKCIASHISFLVRVIGLLLVCVLCIELSVYNLKKKDIG